jgi:hypothetical protein
MSDTLLRYEVTGRSWDCPESYLLFFGTWTSFAVGYVLAFAEHGRRLGEGPSQAFNSVEVIFFLKPRAAATGHGFVQQRRGADNSCQSTGVSCRIIVAF